MLCMCYVISQGKWLCNFCLHERKTHHFCRNNIKEKVSLYLFWQSDCLTKTPSRFLILNTGLNQKFKTSDATAAFWSDNTYGKWTGLAKQQPEKYGCHHDCLPFIAQPPGRRLIRAANEEKSIHSSCTRRLYRLHSENRPGITLKRDHLSSPLYLNRSLCQKWTENMFWQPSQR